MLPRLYAILDLDSTRARGLHPSAVVTDWLDAGVRLVQLRAKGASFGATQALADRMAQDCRRAGALFIVNDRVDVARLSGADGVHLGQDDLPVEDARRLLGDAAIIGRSTHSGSQMSHALDEAVSYVAIGPVYQTATKAKPDAIVGLDGVRAAAEMGKRRGVPLVAIGGITLDLAPAVVAAGADAVAVIADLLVGRPADRAAAFLARLA